MAARGTESKHLNCDECGLVGDAVVDAEFALVTKNSFRALEWVESGGVLDGQIDLLTCVR